MARRPFDRIRDEPVQEEWEDETKKDWAAVSVAYNYNTRNLSSSLTAMRLFIANISFACFSPPYRPRDFSGSFAFAREG